MKTLLPIFLLFSSVSFCQETGTVDNNVRISHKRETDLSVVTLSRMLTKGGASDKDKVKSIFQWITSNIAYDTKGYYNLDNIYAGLFKWPDNVDSVTAYRNYHDNIVKKVLKDRVAICDGYTRLFKSLCDRSGIKSEIVFGYVRWHSDTIGVFTKRIHAWNAVELNGRWHLLDATWASGYSNADVTAFRKEYDEYYFLTQPENMINDHFPIDNKWQLLAVPLTSIDFYNQPFLFSAFRKFKFTSYQPALGVIEARLGDSILFELQTDEPEKYLIALPSLQADSFELSSPKNTLSGNKIGYLFRLSSNDTKELNVIYKGELAIRYRVRMRD